MGGCGVVERESQVGTFKNLAKLSPRPGVTLVVMRPGRQSF